MSTDPKRPDAGSRLEAAANGLYSVRAIVDVKKSVLLAMQETLLNAVRQAGASEQAVSYIAQLFIDDGILGPRGQLDFASKATIELSALARKAAVELTQVFGIQPVLHINPDDCLYIVEMAEQTEKILQAMNRHQSTVCRILSSVDQHICRLRHTSELIRLRNL